MAMIGSFLKGYAESGVRTSLPCRSRGRQNARAGHPVRAFWGQ